MTLPRSQPARSISFAATAEQHLDDVYAYLVYMTRDRSLAEDLTADTFEKALKAWRRFDASRGSARTWLENGRSLLPPAPAGGASGRSRALRGRGIVPGTVPG